RLFNPLSSDLDVMRQTLLFGGLEAIAYNLNRRITNLRFYELGNCYFYSADKAKKDTLDKYSEEQHLALFIIGSKYESNWIMKEEKSSYYQLKSYVENIFTRLGYILDDFKIDSVRNKSDIYIDGLSYSRNNDIIVEFGIILNSLVMDFGIKENVFYCDIYWDNVIKNLNIQNVEFSKLPKYPEVRRDLSMLLNNSITFDQIKKLAFKAENYFLKRINLFDVYTGDKIDKSKKSYAVSFILQDLKKTLTDKQIDVIMNNIASVFTKELGAEIR
ncbi:MAG: phenylalanine--tRNA ligase subunit beta, partial [Bacteroidales bacterium]